MTNLQAAMQKLSKIEPSVEFNEVRTCVTYLDTICHISMNYPISIKTMIENINNIKVVGATQLEEINISLQKGPVLLKFGAMWCEHCKKMMPILVELATEYIGKATVMLVDVDKSSNFADYFGVKGIPDFCVIVGNENGKYVYMTQNGETSMDRLQAKIEGECDKIILKKLLDLALQK